MNNKGIILLSSGLDSLVSLHLASKECEIILALTFDYGQKAAKDEIKAASIIAKQYGIEHKVIKLPYLKEVTKNALSDKSKGLEFENLDENSALNVWVPNRNGLFLNIAAMYADFYSGKCFIIFGANKEESATFPDNSQEFCHAANGFFEFSTQAKPKIFAPVLMYEKYQIVDIGVREGVDFTLLKSCYDSSSNSGKKHCGVCESCKRLYNAIIKSGHTELLDKIFERK